MTEALRGILSFAKVEMNLKQIDAHIFADNASSVKLAQRNGFHYEGETTVYVFRGKEYLHRIYRLKI
jgi:RimJ/RimL family protein N-acetyltransferase